MQTHDSRAGDGAAQVAQPTKYTNQDGVERWQPTSNGERLWANYAGTFWDKAGDEPVLYSSRRRAVRIGARRDRSRFWVVTE